MEEEQYKTKIDMQEEKFTSKKSIVQECTPKINLRMIELLQNLKLNSSTMDRSCTKKGGAKNKLDSYKKKEHKEDTQPIFV